MKILPHLNINIFKLIFGLLLIIPTLWCVIRGYDKNDQRTIIQNFNLITLATTMVIYIKDGIVTTSMIPLFAIVAFSIAIPTLIGARLYIGISEALFKKIVLILLSISGIAFLFSALINLI